MTNKQPFSEVVCHHGPTVMRVCRAMVGPVDADDAWSETLRSALRLAMVCHYLGDLPHAEVAGVIGGTPETVRRAAADGIAKLRKDWARSARAHETKGTVQ